MAKPDLKQFGCEAEMVVRECVDVIGPIDKTKQVLEYLHNQGFTMLRTGPVGDGTQRFRHTGHRDISDPEVV